LDTAAAGQEEARRARVTADARLAAARQGAARAEERARAARGELERASGAVAAAETALAGNLPPDLRDAPDWSATLADQLAGAERATDEAATRLDRARREETEATATVREVQARHAALADTRADRRRTLDALTARCAATAEVLAGAVSHAGGRDLDVFLADLERALDGAEGAARAADDAAEAAQLRAAEATRSRQQTAEALDREGQAGARLHGEGRRLAREIEALEASLRATLGAADAAALAALPGQVSALEAAREELDALAGRRAGREGEMDRARERAAHARASLASAQQRAEAAASVFAAGQCAWQSARQVLDEALTAAGVETAEGTPDALARRRTTMAAERDQGLRAQSLLLAQEGTLTTRIDRATALRQALGQSREKAAIARELGQLLGGPQLRDWLLADAMRLLVEDASVHFERLSDGRYRLQAREIEFEVVDRWNADATRSVKTLSGGETFLAALAVALALADRVAGRAEAAHGQRPLESLFIDEGFGALDPDEALDGVALALEQLQATHRVIGVITHLPHLAERLPAQLRVIKELGRSRVERVAT
ncbi:MAG TPA: SbcC/MukB-like Walker B domain-containing protein, partial [Candidatus Binatia bacterium]|nr:SbcC/MukB-like Walker B domain-containing protein [Candidatus Binatia bacterium]